MKMGMLHTAALASVLAVSGAASAQNILVNVNGQPVVFDTVGPQQVNGRVLVPLRGVLERLGAYVGYEGSTKTVTANKNGVDLQLKLGDRSAMVNGRAVTLDVPAQTYRGSTMVPLRFVGEALGADVRWNAATATVDITTSASNGDPADPNNYTPPSNQNNPGSVGSAAIVINSFDVDQTGTMRGGTKLTFTLVGTPGGKATFSIPGVVTDVPMDEVKTGNYVGTYSVPRNSNLNINRANAVARLQIGNAEKLIQNASNLGIDAQAPEIRNMTPEDNSRVGRAKPNISAVFDDGAGSGIDPRSVRLKIDGIDVSHEAQITENFISYRPDTAFSGGTHRIELTAEDRAGNQTEKRWDFRVGSQAEVIKNFSFDTGGQSMTPGTEVTVTMNGEPNGQASFSIGDRIQDRKMNEVEPGKYVGTYTVRRNDAFDNALIVGKLVTRDGETYTTESNNKINWNAASLDKPSFTSHKEDDKVGNKITLEGRAAPGSKVQIRVDYVKTVLGALRMNGTVANLEVTADDNGVFRTDEIDMSTGLGNGSTVYTVTAVTVGANGKKSEASTLTLKR